MITTARSFDRERQTTYQFTAQVTDQGSPALIGVADVIVTINDVNDNGPRFGVQNQVTSVFENVPAFSNVIQVTVSSHW